MESLGYLKVEDLQIMCDEREEESLTLEFKSCNELIVGSKFWDKKSNQERNREKDDVLLDLTKDVTAFLNSAGGRIIYGIQEKKSRAYKIDRSHSYRLDNKGENISSEKVVDWLRAHIQPPPTLDVYRVLEEPDKSDSRWYLVIEIPQGQQAYMAKDHRFYKRVGNTARPMEQYEVNDVMNRMRGAALDLKMKIHSESQLRQHTWVRLDLLAEITSTNFVASEHGALKVTAAQPIRLINRTTQIVFRSEQFEERTGLNLHQDEYIPHAQSIMVRWGAHTGNLIFPGDWYNFRNRRFVIEVPHLNVIPNPTYVIQTELFTINSTSRKILFSINRHVSGESFEVHPVKDSNYHNIVSSFWETYRLGQKFITEQKSGRL